MVLVGGGGHAAVCLDVLRSAGRLVLGYVAPEPSELDAAHLGGDEDLSRLLGGQAEAFVAIGGNALRGRIVRELLDAGERWPRAPARRSTVSPSARLGRGTIVMPGAVVNARSRLGDAVIVNTSASVDHDCVIGDGVHVAPGSHLAGGVTVGASCFLGVGTIVIPGVAIATGTTTGAGAVVVRDLDEPGTSWCRPRSAWWACDRGRRPRRCRGADRGVPGQHGVRRRPSHDPPAVQQRLFGPVDPAHLSRRDHVRTVPALWNIRAMDQLDMPWWTWGAIRRVPTGSCVSATACATAFEWGSGASTFWLARRCAAVTSVEHHAGFAEATAGMMARFADVELLLRPGTSVAAQASAKRGIRGLDAVRSEKSGVCDLDFRDYVGAIDTHGGGRYDLIVVDGRARAACLAAAHRHLAPGGMVVLDNSDRDRYQSAIAAAGAWGSVERHRGWGPGSPLPWESALITAR